MIPTEIPLTSTSRRRLIFLMSIVIVCFSHSALRADTPVRFLALDSTAIAVATDTLSTFTQSLTPEIISPNDSIQVSSDQLKATKQSTPPSSPSDTLTKAPPRTVDTDLPLPRTKPFVTRMTQWFTRYPNSNVALICALVPGGGQLYNQRYWKIPIVLSALTGCVYAITWNQRLYKEYHTAYADLLSEHPLDYTSWQAFIPPGGNPQDYVNDSNIRSRLENGSKQYKESRDLSIVIAVALYLLSALDAYVDAELYYFDVSPQLTIDMGDSLGDKPSGPRPQSVMVGASFRF